MTEDDQKLLDYVPTNTRRIGGAGKSWKQVIDAMRIQGMSEEDWGPI